ncbi:hypothetical protein EMIT0P12_60339 [Pseudomonas sp. IT-P12]
MQINFLSSHLSNLTVDRSVRPSLNTVGLRVSVIKACRRWLERSFIHYAWELNRCLTEGT